MPRAMKLKVWKSTAEAIFERRKYATAIPFFRAIEIETRTRLSASTEDFFIDTDVEAKEGGETVFTRTWRERVPRDGL